MAKRRSSKLEPFLPVIQEILDSDRKVHRKQRHTAQRIFERLRDEHGYDGDVMIVKDAVREWRTNHREVFLPLSHPPGQAQVDYGYADVFLNGELTKVALFVITLPYSDAIFMQAFPRECIESFLEGHKRAFEFFPIVCSLRSAAWRLALAMTTSRSLSAASWVVENAK